MALVYRLENQTGAGPLAGSENGGVFLGFYLAYHREPYELYQENKCSREVVKDRESLSKMLNSNQYRFGWNELEHMVGFIRKPHKVDETDYRIVVYEIDEADCLTFDDGQVLFRYETAMAVGGFDSQTAGKIFFSKESGQTRFVIRGPVVDGETLYWSNEWGWGSRDGATVFTNLNVTDPIKSVAREPV